MAFIENIPGQSSRNLIVQLQHGFLVSGRIVSGGKGLKGMILKAVTRSTDEGGAPAAVPPPSLVERYKWWGAGAGGLLILIVLAVLLTRRRPQPEPGLLRAGVRVSELEQGLQPGMAFAPPLNAPALQDPAVAMRTRALEDKLAQALSRYFGSTVRLQFELR